MQEHIRTISMAKSKYTWDDIDNRAHKLNMDRSEYLQGLVEKDLNRKIDVKKIDIVIVLLVFVVITILLVVK